jgi:Cation transporting ATPase, C-terminus
LPAPFHPVHIVVLELFMDVGASVAFVSEPTPPGTMDRPPRDPASRFLDATQLSAIAVTAAALTVAVLPAFLIIRARSGTGMAIAAAVAGWLIASVAIAWSLRARPALPLRRNVAFPAWRWLRSSPRSSCRSPRQGRRWASNHSRPTPCESRSASRRSVSRSQPPDASRYRCPGAFDRRGGPCAEHASDATIAPCPSIIVCSWISSLDNA